MAIAVALMAQSHPFAVVPAALFFAALGRLEFLMKMHTTMPRDIVLVLQAVVIMTLLLCHSLLKRWKG
jgi:simple sugar transport system permease protein